jgi:predicted lipase
VKKKKEDEERSNASKSRKNKPTHDNTIVTTILDTNMFKTPIEEFTLLESIPGSLLVTYVGLGFEGAVIVVGDYYYNHKMRAIKKITTKRKREKADTIHETIPLWTNQRVSCGTLLFANNG